MAPFVLRWGIISTGGIATKFAQDLLVDPSTRDAADVSHRITAVGSRSVESAQSFIDKLEAASAEDHAWGVRQGHMKGCKAHGSYEAVYADPDVDVVYIGTPHTYHHRNTKDALLAGKHVLCEKPFTLDMAELDELIDLAKQKNLFLMEAVWTRFHPIAYAVQDLLFSGKLGKVKRFAADFSSDFNPDDKELSNRMVAPELGGGSLLDMGPYPSVWAMLALQHHPDNKNAAPKLITSAQTIYPRTQVDYASRWILRWETLKVDAVLTTDMGTEGFAECTCLIQCQEADIAIHWPPYKPTTFDIVPHAPGKSGSIRERTTHNCPIPAGGGMSYEADESARCIRDGRVESARMPWEESRIVQGWFDSVRKAGDTVLKNAKGTAGQ